MLVAATLAFLGGSSASAAGRASLSFSPSGDYAQDSYVGGQALDWRGNIGANGKRKIRLQSHMNRPGDKWTTVKGFSRTTKSDGSFSFQYRAPVMFDISYRVVSGKLATPRVTFFAKTQDLVVTVNDSDPESPAYVESGENMNVTVDTAPVLSRRPDLMGLPVFPGRVITLQRRDANNRWVTIGTSTTNERGLAYFNGLSAPDGVVVLRARQENWVKDGTSLGWVPSFPYYVYVGVDSPNRPVGTRTSFPGSGPDGITATPQAARNFGWWGVLYDYDWESGQSLTSPPGRGEKPFGYWEDVSTGSGRVYRHNGGMALVSGRTNGPGDGDFGNTYATLLGKPIKYGRWETRLRSKVLEKNQGDYKMVTELIPANPADYDCGSHNVLIASIDSNSNRMTFGADSGTRRWRGSKNMGGIEGRAPAVAIEYTKNHITWFIDGKPIATIKSSTASSKIPMTIRYSLIGQGEAEMNQTMFIMDWTRAYPMGRGKQVVKGTVLKSTTRPNSC